MNPEEDYTLWQTVFLFSIEVNNSYTFFLDSWASFQSLHGASESADLAWAAQMLGEDK
jgi:hypothetical protein